MHSCKKLLFLRQVQQVFHSISMYFTIPLDLFAAGLPCKARCEYQSGNLQLLCTEGHLCNWQRVYFHRSRYSSPWLSIWQTLLCMSLRFSKKMQTAGSLNAASIVVGKKHDPNENSEAQDDDRWQERKVLARVPTRCWWNLTLQMPLSQPQKDSALKIE